MSGTGALYINGRNVDKFTATKLKAIVDCPIISAAISVKATAAAVTEAIQVPAGAYVYRVGVLATGAVAGADFDVGDGTITDRYIDGITTLAANDIAMSGLGGAVNADPVGGHYYSTADTIDVLMNATATTGTIKLLVWWHVA